MGSKREVVILVDGGNLEVVQQAVVIDREVVVLVVETVEDAHRGNQSSLRRHVQHVTRVVKSLSARAEINQYFAVRVLIRKEEMKSEVEDVTTGVVVTHEQNDQNMHSHVVSMLQSARRHHES